MRAIYLSSQGIGAAGAYQLVRHCLLRRFFRMRKPVLKAVYRSKTFLTHYSRTRAAKALRTRRALAPLVLSRGTRRVSHGRPSQHPAAARCLQRRSNSFADSPGNNGRYGEELEPIRMRDEQPRRSTFFDSENGPALRYYLVEGVWAIEKTGLAKAPSARYGRRRSPGLEKCRGRAAITY